MGGKDEPNRKSDATHSDTNDGGDVKKKKEKSVAAAAAKVTCADCGEKKSRECFSKSQWKRAKKQRKPDEIKKGSCTDCIHRKTRAHIIEKHKRWARPGSSNYSIMEENKKRSHTTDDVAVDRAKSAEATVAPTKKLKISPSKDASTKVLDKKSEKSCSS